jgi:hypothetical protein
MGLADLPQAAVAVPIAHAIDVVGVLLWFFEVIGRRCRGHNVKRKATAGRLSDRLLELSVF